MKVAIVGAAGRMGRALVELVRADPALELSARVDVAPGYDSEWPADTRAVVDFSFHEAVPGNVGKAADAGVAYVIGTTGLTADEQARVNACAKRIPVVQAANYSLGVNLLLGLVEKAAAVLGPEYDVEIVEMHHRHKKDAPSGTALMLARAAAAGRGVKLEDVAAYGREGMTGERPRGEFGIHALRGGSVVGDHAVTFAGDLEMVSFSHRAQGREAFAAGALKAAAWAAGRAPGLYGMRHVLGMA